LFYQIGRDGGGFLRISGGGFLRSLAGVSFALGSRCRNYRLRGTF